uniref:LRRNT domain-containing protein n=1 Tax=Tetranychus urticae TaxID=32264 RepID=T1KTD9_TETUR
MRTTFRILLFLYLPLLSYGSFNCFLKCNCVYKSNKLHADCGSLSLTELPQVND